MNPLRLILGRNFSTQLLLAIRFLTIPILICSLGACSTLSSFPTTYKSVEQLIAERDYQAALRQLDSPKSSSQSLSESHTFEKNPDTSSQNTEQDLVRQAARETRLKNQIETESAAHTQLVIQEALSLVDDSEWRRAKMLLIEAQGKVLPSDDLDQYLGELLDNEYELIEREQILEAIKRGRWIAQNYKLHKMLIGSNQETLWTPYRLRRIQKQQEVLAEKLLQYGHLAIKQDDFSLAQRCYATMRVLWIPRYLRDSYRSLGIAIAEEASKDDLDRNISDDLNNSLSDNEKSVDSSRKKKAESKSKIAKQEAKRKSYLLSRLKKQIRVGDLVSINRLVQGIRQLEPLSKREANKLDEAGSFVDAQVQLLDRQAEQLYGEGYISAANGIWAMLLKIDQANMDWQSKFLRSQKVLDNLQQLREDSE